MRGAQFRILGFPVRIDGSFLFVALFGLTTGSVQIALVWIAVVFVTTLVHELGHAFAFRAYGREASITLWGLGGLTHGAGGSLGRGRDIVVSLAGPLTEMIVIGAPALYISAHSQPTSPTSDLALRLLVWIGVGWAAVNLLPILPLDGGRISANVLEIVWGEAGARAARWISMAVALAGGIFAATHGFIFAAFFALYFISQNRADLQRMREGGLAQRLAEGHRLLDRGDVAGAERIAAALASKAHSPALLAAAAELHAWAALRSGRRADAAAALARLPAEARPSPAIVAYTLLLDGMHDEAVDATVRAFLEGVAPPNAQLAVALERFGLLDRVVDELLIEPETGPAAAAALAAQLHIAGRDESAERIARRL